MSKKDSIHVVSLELEAVKRVKALRLKPTPTGLTVIGGKNGQGKTSVLDAIAWCCGGGKYSPSTPKNATAMSDPKLKLVLSNGIIIERRGKASTLYVTDPSGQKAGQGLLDSLIGQFALDMPKFLNSSTREKAESLLNLLGIGTQLKQLDLDEKKLYNERHAIGQIADAKRKHGDELPEYPDAPEESISAIALIQGQQEILARNGRNQELRNNVGGLQRKLSDVDGAIEMWQRKLDEAQAKISELMERKGALLLDLDTANKTATALEDESTAELEAQLADIETINARVAANAAKAVALDEAEQYRAQYDAKTRDIEALRKKRMDLLAGVKLPLPGLEVVEGELLYNGQKWDCMSSAEQLRVSASIVRAQKPECGFVLMDKLEQMDLDTLNDFGQWAITEGLQIIATRVSTGAECTLIIEDGLPIGETYADVVSGVAEPVAAEPNFEEFEV